MTRQIEAIYENGVFRPLQPLSLGERERVRLIFTNEISDPLEEMIDREFLETTARELAGFDLLPTSEEVQAILGSDRSSWSDAIIADRREH